MAYLRSVIVVQAQSWIGCKESDGTHKAIIDVYNAHTPLARSYKVKYTDAWCATFVSAVSIKCGYTAIIPTECSCNKMIELFKNLGEWQENDAYVPDAGDIIFYDWDDTTGSSSDNTGSSDHVGIVEKVSGTTITVIEGNYSDSVKRRTLQVNGKYIRGYGLPKYTDSTTTSTTTSTASTTSTTSSTSSSTSTSTSTTTYNKTEQWIGVVTASSLNVRTNAGTSYSKCSFSPLSKGTEVSVCDSAKASDGSTWYYIKYNSKYGFVSATYISKKTSSSSATSTSTTTKKTATESAKSYLKSLAGTYTTTAALNMRNGAGTTKSVMVTLPKGTKVTNYGYYTTVSNTKWLYVQVTYNNIVYTGFCSNAYLNK